MIPPHPMATMSPPFVPEMNSEIVQLNWIERGTVAEVINGPRAPTYPVPRTQAIVSMVFFQVGQLYGSLGSSDGCQLDQLIKGLTCGTRITFPVLSCFNLEASTP